MRKFTIALVSIFLIASISGPAHSAQMTAKKFSSCADVLKNYPNGVAKDKKARNKAVKGGFAKPKVSKTVVGAAVHLQLGPNYYNNLAFNVSFNCGKAWI